MPNPTITPQNFTRGTSEMTLDQFNQQLRQSPLYATWMAQNGIRTDKPIKLSKDQRQNFATFLQSNGVPIPKDFHVDEAGNFNQKSRVKGRIIKGALIGGAAAGAIFGAPVLLGHLGMGGGGIALPGSIGGGTVAALPGALGAGGGLAAGGAGAVTGATVAGAIPAAAKAPSLWSKLSGPIIEAGIPAAANVAGAMIGANATKSAAKMEADAAREALAWQKDVYAERQRQMAPAIGVGNGATMKLGDLMGIKAPEGGYQPNLPQTPQAAQRQPTAPGAATGMVPMRAPTGQVSMVAPDQVSHYEQRGATRVV